MEMTERLAIIDGLRSPMAKAGTALKNTQVDDLGATVARELINRTKFPVEEIDEVIIGNVAQPTHAANVARVIGLKADIPNHVPGYTVHRNCASGMESMTTAWNKIVAGHGTVFLTGGVESMSNIPLLFNQEYSDLMNRLMRSKTGWQKLKTLFGFRLRMLKPEIGLIQGLTDPVSGLIMGMTAENLAREFHITRDEQDRFALRSHELAIKAQKEGSLEGEVVPVPTWPDFQNLVTHDIGPRENQSMESLGKLKPYFDRRNGTVTVGNSSQVTDGAAVALVMPESEAKKRGYEPLGYVRDYAYASLEPERMGLGPVYSTSRLFDRTGATMADIEYTEINEAFAAQVLACERAFGSDEFAKTFLGKDRKVGELDMDNLNAQGGAIAIGHPVGMTGTRIVVHTLKELRRQGKNTGLATLCVGGGQGAALLLEVA
jgi:acetyl-CoA C-acetyltransferase/acetyl-CoA acyltransferase